MGDVWIKGSKYYCDACKLHVHLNSKRNHETSKKHITATQQRLNSVLKKHGMKSTKDQLLIHDIEYSAMQRMGQRIDPSRVTKRKLPTKIDASLYGLGGDFKDSQLPKEPIWVPPDDFDIDPLGPWQPVEPQQDTVVKTAPVETAQDAEYEEDEMGDDPSSFKVTEKVIQVQESCQPAVFKKRIIKAKNTRK